MRLESEIEKLKVIHIHVRELLQKEYSIQPFKMDWNAQKYKLGKFLRNYKDKGILKSIQRHTIGGIALF